RGPAPVARDFEAEENRVIAEFVRDRPPLLLEHVGDHDVRALGDEAAYVAGAHSTGTARDDHRPIIETSHDLSPFLCRVRRPSTCERSSVEGDREDPHILTFPRRVGRPGAASMR